MSDRCHCRGCKVWDRRNDHCRRSIVYAEDNLCVECHKQTAVKDETSRKAG
jgi:hypothetical protein